MGRCDFAPATQSALSALPALQRRQHRVQTSLPIPISLCTFHWGYSVYSDNDNPRRHSTERLVCAAGAPSPEAVEDEKTDAAADEGASVDDPLVDGVLCQEMVNDSEWHVSRRCQFSGAARGKLRFADQRCPAHSSPRRII